MCNGLPTEIKFKGDTIMNYTSNHHLPQWNKSDRILMDDFNAAMANIDSSLTANAQAAANARSAASSAQSTANTARKEAADLPYVVGTYTGAETDHTVNLGFRPSYVIINGILEIQGSPGIETFGQYSCAAGRFSNIPSCLVFTDSGFIAKKTKSIFPNLVDDRRKYEYIAFK